MESIATSASVDSRNRNAASRSLSGKVAAGRTRRCVDIVEKTILIVIMVIAFLLLFLPSVFYHLPVDIEIGVSKQAAV